MVSHSCNCSRALLNPRAQPQVLASQQMGSLRTELREAPNDISFKNRARPNWAVKRTPTRAMPSAFSWPLLVPCAPSVLRRRLPWALGHYKFHRGMCMNFPQLIAELHEREFDYADGEGMDFEPFQSFLPPEEVQDWFKAWTGNKEADGSKFLVFGKDGSGGFAAIWLANESASVLDQ